MQFYDKKDNTVYSLRVPTKQGRQLFVYYRALTVQDKVAGLSRKDKILYKVFQKEKRKTLEKQHIERKKAKERPLNTKRMLGDITLKTFANPMGAKKKKEEEGPKKRTEEEAIDNIPVRRSVLVFNFDMPFVADEVRSWFKTIGGIQNTFVGQHMNKTGTNEGKKSLFFAVVVFKSVKDMQICYDHPAIFQERVYQLLKKQNITIDEAERAEYREKLITTFAADEISGKKDEFVERMEQDGFTMVTDHLGGYDKFNTTFGKEEEEERKENADGDEDEFDMGPTKKNKKSHSQNDFYRFQVKNNAAIKNLGIKGFNRKNEDVMGTQIHQLKKGFQDDVERLKQMRKNKDKKNVVTEEDSEYLEF